MLYYQSKGIIPAKLRISNEFTHLNIDVENLLINTKQETVLTGLAASMLNSLRALTTAASRSTTVGTTIVVVNAVVACSRFADSFSAVCANSITNLKRAAASKRVILPLC